MSKVSITKSKLDELAASVSEKSGGSLPLTIDEMRDAVDGISSAPTLQTKSVTPTESAQTVTADAGYDGLDEVDVGAISSTYVGSGISTRSDSDLFRDSEYVVVPSGYYESESYFQFPIGTEGTPTATKGNVSNHSIDVTPSVTNTEGYIGGQTKTGTAVSVSASELVSGSETKTANGTYDVTNLAELVVNISGGGGGGSASDPVRFIDYDGTVLHSYSVEDFMALTAMPANPTHSGLTSQGWNWSLADAKAQLTKYPEAGLTIGQMYITDDGKTRLYVRFEEGRLHPYLGICPNGTVVVDWGDNSATSTLTGTSLTTVQHTDHEYASAGDYVITLTVSSGSFAFYGVSNTAHILKKNTTTTLNIHRVYANCLERVEVGANAHIGNYAFRNCYSLASITIPDSVTSIGNYVFYGCYSLASITIPDGVTSIGTSAFSSCHSLASITIPDSVISIDVSAFINCYSLASITIPDGVTSIGSSVFNNCYGMAEYHFLSITPPTLDATSAFTNIQSDCKIYVPAASLTAYQTATNWSTYASYMVGE